jgi:hypothetical protein
MQIKTEIHGLAKGSYMKMWLLIEGYCCLPQIKWIFLVNLYKTGAQMRKIVYYQNVVNLRG